MNMLELILNLVIPAILLASVCVSFMVIRATRTRFGKASGKVKVFFVAATAAYVFVVISVVVFDQFLTWRMHSFDIDGNGVFTDAESTEALFVYQAAVVNDLGRNLAPITSIVVAVFAAGIALAIERALSRFRVS